MSRPEIREHESHSPSGAARRRPASTTPDEATARLAAIVESSSDAIASKTLEGIITSWNGAAERMFGYTEAEAVGQHISLIIPEELLHEEDVIIRRVRRGERVEPFETRRRTKDGRIIDVSLSISPIIAADGSIIGASKIARDITDRRQTEALLARQAAHLNVLLDASRLFAESHFDLPELMRHLMDILVPSLADSGYVRRLSDDGGSIETVVVRHRDPGQEHAERTLTAALQPAHEGMTGELIRTGRPVFMPVIDNEVFRRVTAPQYQHVVGTLRMASYIMVPMRARGKVVGALGVGRVEDSPRFTVEDLDVVQKLADQAALAMATWDSFRLLEREKEAAMRSERRFRTLADHAPDMIARLDSDGRYRYVNPRFASNVGIAAEQFLGRTNQELGFPKEFCRAWEEKLPEAFSGSEALMEFEFAGPEGARQYQAKLVPEPGADGTVRTVLAMARDVTELARRVRRNEEAFLSIGSMAERLRGTADVDLLLDTLVVDAMKLVGAEGGCAGLRTPAGMATKRYFRKDEILPLEYTWGAGEGLPGWLIEHRVPYVTNDAASDPQIVPALCRSFGVWSALSMPILDGEGEAIGFFELHNKRDGTPFSDEDRQRLNVISHTASVALQSALAMRRAQHAETQEREKAAELGELVNELETFAYSVAHDLRAPVRAMDGYSQILLEDYSAALGSHGQALAKRITESSRRMDHMIRDLLAYSRLSREEVALQPVALEEAVADAVDQLRGEVSARHAEITIDHPLPLVIAHPAVLRQVIVNLLSNAMKFVAPGIRPGVRVRTEPSGAMVRLRVEDNGIGIAPEYHARLFRVFERLHGPDAYPGTGIGLAIVRRGIERMGGTVGVESQVGAGSRFWLELPAAGSHADKGRVSHEENHERNH